MSEAGPDFRTCPYCGSAAVLHEDSTSFYGKDHGPLWACLPCQAWVGCHPDTVIPLGRLATRDLRRLKSRAHAAFDLLWKQGGMTRKGAYRWLADQMGLAVRETHVGWFDEAQCHRVEALALWWIEEGHTSIPAGGISDGAR